MTFIQIHEDEYGGHFNWNLWRRILGHARRHARWGVMMIVSGAVLAGLETMMPLITAWLIDEVISVGITPRFTGLSIVYLGLVSLFSLIVWLFIRAGGRLSTGVAFDLREKGFSRLQDLSFGYFDTRPVGWLVSRLTADCTKLSSLMPWFFLDLSWAPCFLVGIIIAMMSLDWQLGLWVLTIIPPLAIVSIYFQRRLLVSSRLVRRTNSIITGSFNETLMGVRTTPALAREEESLEEFQKLSSDMQRYSVRNSLQSAVYLPLVITIGSVGVGMALWKGSVDIQGSMGISLGTLIAFMQYAVLFSMPIQEIAARLTDLQAAQSAAERVQSLLETQPGIADSPEVIAAMAAAPTSSTIDGGDATITSVTFDHVDFWYKEEEPVLIDFNLHVTRRQTIALVGPTGGGKTTITSLIARFYEPCRGAVQINGVDSRSRSLHWLQSNLGVVLQDPHLFSGTIRENIRYGNLDASDAEVADAAKIVGAVTFINALGKGFDSEVGERGGRLSVGERQLVALARAILADPQIFIMDEATSSVDTGTEMLIQSAIDTVLRDRIAFVVAHRLSTIRAADVILVIDGGKIVEQGCHSELIERRGTYWRLYTRQSVEEDQRQT